MASLQGARRAAAAASREARRCQRDLASAWKETAEHARRRMAAEEKALVL